MAKPKGSDSIESSKLKNRVKSMLSIESDPFGCILLYYSNSCLFIHLWAGQ